MEVHDLPDGETFVWIEWKKTGDVAGAGAGDGGGGSRARWGGRRIKGGGRDGCWRAVYPESWRQSWKGGLPHEYQMGNPVGMLAKIRSNENLWWQAEGGGKRVFGVGIPANMRGRMRAGDFWRRGWIAQGSRRRKRLGAGPGSELM